ncbi:MAG: sulfatase, partial [Anaerolineae bacterium]|nr:sulfatase [Anaerolineae bacterium]
VIHTLSGVGYRSALAGIQHIAAEAETIGYDEVLSVGSSRVEHVAPAVCEFLHARPQEPFFLSVGFFETHREYPRPGPEDDARYTLPPGSVPDTPETREDFAAFKASARRLDWGVGQVLDALDGAGLAENTLVICTTDHGIAFPRMKCNLTDSGIGVMLIMRGPGGFEGGRVCDALVSHIDLFPTLCDLLEIEPPDWLQGTSLMPLVRGEAEEVRDEVFAEVTYHAAYEPQRAVRTRRWKYIRRFDGREAPVLPNCDDSLSKDVWMRHGWQDHPPSREQLFDVVFDPAESNNLASDPSLADVLGDMRARLDRWMHETDDPLLDGPVPAPHGARVNDTDGVSPQETPLVIE